MKDKNEKVFKIITIIVFILIIALGSVKLILDYKKHKPVKEETKETIVEPVEIKKSIDLESGGKIPTIEDYIIKRSTLSNNIEITYENKNKELENKELLIKTIYYDQDNNEISKENALEEDILKEGYTKIDYIIGTGSYDVSIIDLDTKEEYKSELNIIDTTKPVLELVEQVEITDGDKIDITKFIKSCIDNSASVCTYKYIEETEEGINELETIDLKVGTKDIKIIAYDESNNQSDIQVSKLVVKEKPKPVQKPTTTTKPSTTKPSTNTTTKPTTSTNDDVKKGYTRTKCLHDMNYKTGAYYNITFDFGCDSNWHLDNEFYEYEKKFIGTGNAFYVDPNDQAPLSRLLYQWIDDCENHYGDSCRTLSYRETIFHRYDNGYQDVGVVRGIDAFLTIYHDDEEVAYGHINSDLSIAWKFKNY